MKTSGAHYSFDTSALIDGMERFYRSVTSRLCGTASTT